MAHWAKAEMDNTCRERGRRRPTRPHHLRVFLGPARRPNNPPSIDLSEGPLRVCAVKGGTFQWVQAPPATAPAGSNRGSHGGDEMAEAFG